MRTVRRAGNDVRSAAVAEADWALRVAGGRRAEEVAEAEDDGGDAGGEDQAAAGQG